MGLTVVAEGSETLSELDHLRGMNCEFGQGYILSEPLTPEATMQLIESDLSAVRLAG